jgi:hypothetical protein
VGEEKAGQREENLKTGRKQWLGAELKGLRKEGPEEVPKKIGKTD